MQVEFDAVVIGAGPNGLVAANVLADAGWRVMVLEAQATPGGAVRSDSTFDPGFVVDRFSAFFPLAVTSPALAALDLESHGLEWCHAPQVLAHPTKEGPAVVLSRDLDRTARSLDQFHPGDGAAWESLYAQFRQLEQPLFALLMGPFPPLRPSVELLRRAGVRGGAEFLRTALLPVRRLAEEHFTGAGGGLMLAGNALHTDLTPETSGSGFYGLILASIAQGHGWPVPRGGAQELTKALVRRFEARGGEIRTHQPVAEVVIKAGRARGVRTKDGEEVVARRAVVADVVAPHLYGDLIAPDLLPPLLRRDLARYQRADGTFKVNWTLNRPIPWTDPAVADAGTVHLGESMDELTMTAAQLSCGLLPERPFILLGQMTTSDPARSPPGTESVWAYTSVPQQIKGDADPAGLTGAWSKATDRERFADRLEARIEAFAPGFRAAVRGRQIQAPNDLESADSNLLGGDKNLGTANLHQQLIFRPTLGFARPETFLPGLYLASASAHPGGGVHGACGANAARAALLHDRINRAVSLISRPWRQGK